MNTYGVKGEGSSLIKKPHQAEETSEDSASTDEGLGQGIQYLTHHLDYCQRMSQMFQIKDGQAKHFELDSKVGLNGSQTCWSFPCIYDQERQKFFVWLGDITIERFTKTTFLNLANFAENTGAKQMVLITMRDHAQKSKLTAKIIRLAQFQKLFKVLDGERVSKRGMQELMGAEKLEEHVEKFALYRIKLQ
jgi:hypothetical protein